MRIVRRPAARNPRRRSPAATRVGFTVDPIAIRNLCLCLFPAVLTRCLLFGPADFREASRNPDFRRFRARCGPRSPYEARFLPVSSGALRCSAAGNALTHLHARPEATSRLSIRRLLFLRSRSGSPGQRLRYSALTHAPRRLPKTGCRRQSETPSAALPRSGMTSEVDRTHQRQRIIGSRSRGRTLRTTREAL